SCTFSGVLQLSFAGGIEPPVPPVLVVPPVEPPVPPPPVVVVLVEPPPPAVVVVVVEPPPTDVLVSLGPHAPTRPAAGKINARPRGNQVERIRLTPPRRR